MNIQILYQDEDIAVCIKPAGVQSENEGMPALLGGQTGAENVYCVHRLDAAAAGVMVYALRRNAAASLSAQIAERSFLKRYYAVVQGRPQQDEAVLKDLLYRDRAKNKSYVVRRKRGGVKEAELSYRVCGETGELTLLDISLHTGRTHQIRVQFSSRGFPLVGDGKYGSRYRGCPMALWSRSICFRHPRDGREMVFEALPEQSFPWNEFVTEESHEIH